MLKNPLYFLIYFGLCLLPMMQAKAQQYPVYSQYIFNGLVINPAYAGSHVQLSATAMHRNQWVNFDGAPKTSSISAHSTLGRKVGVGFLLTNDEIGSYSNQSLFGSYAYILKTPVGGTLSFGLQAGFSLTSADFSELNLVNPGDGSFAPFSNKFKPNFGAGVFYRTDWFFAGFSVPFLLNNTVSNDLEGAFNDISEARYYYLHGGLNLPLTRDRKIVFTPALLIRSQEGSPLSLDVNVGFVFNEVFSLGASYRNIDALITYIQLKVSDHFNFGYSYDWTTSDLNQFSSGTHEFSLNYRIRLRKFHGNVECPSIFRF